LSEKVFSIGDSLSYGWDKFKKHYAFLIGILILIFFINLIMGIFSSIFEETFPVLDLIFNILTLVISFFLTIGTINIYLKIYDEKQPSIHDLYDVTPSLFFRCLLAAILVGLIVLVGLLLFIIPGIIIIIMLQYFIYIIVDKDLDSIESIKESRRITSGYKWDLLLLYIVLAGLNLLGILCFGIGLLVTIPVSSLAYIYVYKKLADRDIPINSALSTQTSNMPW